MSWKSAADNKWRTRGPSCKIMSGAVLAQRLQLILSKPRSASQRRTRTQLHPVRLGDRRLAAALHGSPS
eukprot:176184-Chlamydomonas_euryale.AAC.1